MSIWRYRAEGELTYRQQGRRVYVDIDHVRAVHRRKLQNNPAHRYRLRRAQENGTLLI